MTRHKGLRLSELTVSVHCLLDEKTATELKKYASHTHIPKVWVINEAVKLYLGTHESGMHAHIPRVYKERPISSGLLAIIEEMKRGYWEKTIPIKELEGIIRKVRGNDKRTVKNWLNSLIKLGFLKLKVDNGYENKIYAVKWKVVPQEVWPEDVKKEFENGATWMTEDNDSISDKAGEENSDDDHF